MSIGECANSHSRSGTESRAHPPEVKAPQDPGQYPANSISGELRLHTRFTSHPNPGSACLAVLAWISVGCAGPSVVNLSYQHGSYAHRVTPVRVGVYHFDDDRPGWPATAAMRMFDQGVLHTEGGKAISVFVAEALRSELAATGIQISTSPEFNRQIVYATSSGTSASGASRVIVGRINYFGLVGPVPKPGVSPTVIGGGAVGVALESARQSREREGVSLDEDDMPSKAYVDLDLQVVEPGTGRILWAGATRVKRNAGYLAGAVSERVAEFLSETLCLALKDAIWRSDFLAALGTALPAKSSVDGAPAHERKAKALFESERFAEAAREYERAYAASRDPAFLFNIGLCYRRVGDAKSAIIAYEEYLRQVPNSPQRSAVEGRIQELKQRLAEPNQR
jgi:hypothetical protein